MKPSLLSNSRAFVRRVVIQLINILLLGVSLAASYVSMKMKNLIEESSQNQKATQSTTSHITLQYSIVFMNALIAELLNILYDQIYIKMNDYESYSNVRKYERALILKRFNFKFINMFNSMVIIALLKSMFPNIFGRCIDFEFNAQGSTLCFGELRIQGSISSLLI